jgi:hypothetical protein
MGMGIDRIGIVAAGLAAGAASTAGNCRCRPDAEALAFKAADMAFSMKTRQSGAAPT